MKNRDIQELKSQVEEIKNLNLESIDFDDLLKKTTFLMKEYTCVQFPATNNTVYRIRKNKKGNNGNGNFELFTKVGDLCAPKPDNMAKDKFGRANRPQKPVFYCSNSPETAISEASIHEGDWITVMRCQNKKDLSSMKIVGFGFPDKAEFKSRDGKQYIRWEDYKREKIGNQYRNEYKNNKIVEECLSKNKLIDEFLSGEFRRQVDSEKRNFEYKITAVIASLYLDNPNCNSEVLDGICYPSVYGQTSSPNWALTVKTANEFYNPFYFETIEIGEIIKENNKIQYCGNLRFKSIEITQSGAIKWKRNN